jgi:hypothetical protein
MRIKKESSRDTVIQHDNTENGSNENGNKSPNLLTTTDDDETVLENKKKSKPNDDKEAIMQQLQEQEEMYLGGTRKEA